MLRVFLEGRVFGKLKVVKELVSETKERRFLCKCSCGNTKEIGFSNLLYGGTKSCGCLQKEKARNRGIKVPKGTVFGRLKIVRELPQMFSGNKKRRLMECVCVCGSVTKVLLENLRSGHTRSCKCLSKDTMAETMSSHKMSGHRAYSIWSGMKTRCTNPNAEAYKYYGAKGISVCDRWKEFKNFWEDMRGSYKENLTIDRVDCKGNYEPKNCVWSTTQEQANNRNNTIIFNYRGCCISAGAVSELTGVKRATLTERKRAGWCDKDCYTKPVKEVKRK